jgi:hypothetical protein
MNRRQTVSDGHKWGDTQMRRKLLPLILASMLVMAFAPVALAQNNSRQLGLVNVSTGDVELLNGVNLAVAANVIATVCDVTIPVAVLATQIAVEGGDTFCEGSAAPITIEQAQPGGGGGPGSGGNNSAQAGLVNVSLGDVEILNDANIAVAANVLVTACDLTVGAAVLAVQGISDFGDTDCQTAAGPITIDQAQ